MEETNDDYVNYKLIFGLFFATCGLLLFYILRIIKKDDEQVTETDTKNESSVQTSDKKRDSNVSSKGKKKVNESRWTGRNDKQGFSHPWLLTTLKGHTGQVLDMEFSNNGKYLASCAEEDPDPGGHNTRTDESSQNSSEKDTPSPRTKGLSRRQRKNRRREDTSPPDVKKIKNKPKQQQRTTNEITPIIKQPQLVRLNISEAQLYVLIRTYLLSGDQMFAFGYPMESSIYPGRAVIYKGHAYAGNNRNNRGEETRFDVNAREFVPSFVAKYDSCGQNSGSSSDSDLSDLSDLSSSSSDLDYVKRDFVGVSVERKCMRCDKGFFIANDNEYLTQEKCFYHWGKLHSILGVKNRCYGVNVEFSCCGGKPQTRGCSTGRLHVWNGVTSGQFNGPYENYAKTRQRRNHPLDGNFGIYALDCEMCFTVCGLELTKITVVSSDGRLVYDSFVRPDNEIIDYNTRFSGITAKDLKKHASKTLREVQNDLMGFISADTILVGHGLENDLRALRIMHFSVVDTAVAYPHPNGLPFRKSLKALASYYLKKDIQTSSQGHNSYEDATTAMELMLAKVRKDYKAIVDLGPRY